MSLAPQVALASPPSPSRLASLTTEGLRAVLAAGHPVVALVPVGSTEPHGPHLPLSTDVLISEGACARAIPMLERAGYTALIAPSVPYGVTDFAEGFSGAVSIPAPVLTAYLRAIIDGLIATGFAHVSLVNNHLEPAHDAAVRAALAGHPWGKAKASVACPLTRRWARELGDEFRSGACHAGRYETSIVMAVAPEVVDVAAAATLPDLAISLSDGIRRGVNRFADLGLERAYTGSPGQATPVEGRSILERLATMVTTEVVEALAPPPDGALHQVALARSYLDMSEKSGGNPSDKSAPAAPNFSVEKTVVGKPIPKHGNRRGVLRVANGLDAGRVLSIPPGGVITFGRADDCSFRFDDTSLSRVHARVMIAAGQYVFQDLNSTNGSYVNDQQVQGAVTLKDGDRIQLGSSTLLRFSLVDEAEEQAMKRVYDAALRDGLTGVFNRKHLEERIDAELAFALRHSLPLSLAIFDVDKFKNVNDTYGHPAGDAVLKATAGILGSTLRTEDVLARFGGEEFVIVLRGVALDGAVAMAERLREQLARTPILFGAVAIPVTASAGVASLTCCGTTPDKASMVRIADERLYTAKQTGRNRVVGG